MRPFLFPIILFLTFLFSFHFGPVFSQKVKIAAGPYQMHTTEHTTKIWLMFKGAEGAVRLKGGDGNEEVRLTSFAGSGPYTPVIAEVRGMEPGNIYALEVLAGEKVIKTFPFRQFSNLYKEKWSFITGSCAFKEFGPKAIVRMGSPKIYTQMGTEPAEFMLWLGDNIYYMTGEWFDYDRMMKKQIHVRLVPELNAFMQLLPHYSIWDDHDYGPNNGNRDFENKEWALEINRKFWGNPYYGTENTPGNFSHFSYQDADFFLTDGRYYMSPDGSKEMELFGKGQMQWLKQRLRESDAKFKFIALGIQALNDLSPYEDWHNYPEEREAFFKFLQDEKIEGVIFLTGDRHHTELLKYEKIGYPLYEFTCSPMMTIPSQSGSKGEEANHPDRVAGSLIAEHNYGKVTIWGLPEDRVCKIEVLSKYGDLLFSYEISANDLQFR